MSGAVTVIEIERDDQNKILTNYGFLKSVSKNLSEFMSNSSIHGFKYLVGSDRTILERSLWFFILIISICTCFMSINSTLKNWEENPTFIGVGQTPVRQWEIPFPAVTICPGYQFNRPSNYTFLYIPDGIEREINVSTSCLTWDVRFEVIIRNLSEGPEFEDYLLQTAIPPEQFLNMSDFGWSEISVAPFLTEFGVCYSFNMLDRNELLRNTTYIPDAFGQQINVSNWSFDKNYYKSTGTVYPLRSRTEYDYLDLYLNSYLNQEECVFNTYWIMLHHPAEIPSTRSKIFMGDKKKYDIIITPDITNTVDSLKNYPPARKRCYFSDERYLRYYKIYTEVNCKLECRANYTLAICGCVPFYLPHEKTTKLCQALAMYGIYEYTLNSSSACMEKAQKSMLESESGLQDNDSDVPLCNCLPSCNLIIYNTEVKVSDSYDNETWVSVRFKEAEFRVWMRQDLFGGVNFWANCGGLLGLFMGFSLISVVEFLYYLFFRLLYRFMRQLWEQLNFVDLYLR